MAYQTILVHLGTAESAAGLSRVAADLASQYSAHLIGLHVTADPAISSTLPPDMARELRESLNGSLEANAKKIEDIFQAAVRDKGISTDFRKIGRGRQGVAEVVMRHGRSADLLILAQPEKDLDVMAGIEVAEEVMLGIGRPVLFVPKGGARGPLGNRILVAWKDSREAAHAVSDAMPFLQRAETVRVFCVDQSTGTARDDQYACFSNNELVSALGRQGVRCDLTETESWSPGSAPSSVAEEINAQAMEAQSDMVVMGGYGHSRLRQIVFGGATRQMLDQMIVPVLMSH